jgi:alpha-tubulin suppressor-like RCC1 family protein
MNFPDPIVKVACGSGHTAILSNKNELYVFGRGR